MRHTKKPAKQFRHSDKRGESVKSERGKESGRAFARPGKPSSFKSKRPPDDRQDRKENGRASYGKSARDLVGGEQPEYSGTSHRRGDADRTIRNRSQSDTGERAYPSKGRTSRPDDRINRKENGRPTYKKSARDLNAGERHEHGDRKSNNRRDDNKNARNRPQRDTPERGLSLLDRTARQDKRPYSASPYTKPASPFAKKPFSSRKAPRGQLVQREEGLAKRPEVKNPTPWQTPEKAHQDSVFLWGVHAVREAWLNPQRRCYRLWLSENSQEAFEKFKAEAQIDLLKRPDPKIADRQTLDRLIPPGSVHQGVILEAAPLHQPPLHDLIGGDTPPDLILILDQVTDPHNVGAILRSAAAFQAGAVIMTERNAPDTTGVLAKTASGAVEHIPVLNVVNLARTLDELHDAGYWSVGLAEEGDKDLGGLDLSGRTVIVLGAEGEGLRQLTRKKCNELARLPTGGKISSLNVSNAAAVALYEVRRQRKA